MPSLAKGFQDVEEDLIPVPMICFHSSDDDNDNTSMCTEHQLLNKTYNITEVIHRLNILVVGT